MDNITMRPQHFLIFKVTRTIRALEPVTMLVIAVLQSISEDVGNFRRSRLLLHCVDHLLHNVGVADNLLDVFFPMISENFYIIHGVHGG